jgi:hypothetical protein
MDRFIRRQNVELYRRLLERVTEESDRQKIINLLTEEQQKQKDAGDSLWYNGGRPQLAVSSSRTGGQGHY